MTDINKFPPGWDEARVRSLIEHYDSLTEEEWLAEDEAAREDETQTFVAIPTALLPAVRDLLAKHEQAALETPDPTPTS